MKKQKVMSDALVKKRLKKIEKQVLKRAKRQIRQRALTAESLELFLPSVSEQYVHLRAELRNDHGRARGHIDAASKTLLSKIESDLNTLGPERHRLEEAYGTTRQLAADAGIPAAELFAADIVTIEPLRERLTNLKSATTEETSK
jgi:hypothetical protein